MKPGVKWWVLIVPVVLFSVAGTLGAATRPKFKPSGSVDAGVGRYVVTLAEDTVADDLGALKRELAALYGGQLEANTSSDGQQFFSVSMMPSRARLLSTDHRVSEVAEVSLTTTASTPPETPAVDLLSAASPRRFTLQPSGFGDNGPSGTYTYDGAGNITAIGADTYRYDTAQRLVSSVTRGVQEDYSYDAFGNRKSATGAVNCLGQTTCAQTVTLDSNTNHLTMINGAAVTYDDAGNIKTIAATSGNPGATYTYDGTGMMTEASVGSDDRQFIYTAGDERIAVKQGTSWSWTVRDLSGKVLREFTSLETGPNFAMTNWQWTKDYIWRDGLLLATTTSTGTLHYHLDHLGTPRLVTDANGVKVAEHAYYPFGAEINLTPHEAPEEAMKFTGHERDTVSGDGHTLDYMHARYYSPPIGRFSSVDPVLGKSHDPQTWNRYAYVGNNPITYNDPNGKERPFNPSHFDWTAFNRDVTTALKFLSTPQGKALAVQVVLALVVHNVASAPTSASAPIPVTEAPLPSVLSPPEVLPNGGLPSTLRYTQPGETFIRYESGNPAFSKISSNGNVAPGTYAAPASDGVVPVSGRAGAYNLPSPEIPRSQVFQLQPAAGTPIIGPRPVAGGTGNEVIFPAGGQCTVTTLGSQ